MQKNLKIYQMKLKFYDSETSSKDKFIHTQDLQIHRTNQNNNSKKQSLQIQIFSSQQTDNKQKRIEKSMKKISQNKIEFMNPKNSNKSIQKSPKPIFTYVSRIKQKRDLQRHLFVNRNEPKNVDELKVHNLVFEKQHARINKNLKSLNNTRFISPKINQRSRILSQKISIFHQKLLSIRSQQNPSFITPKNSRLQTQSIHSNPSIIEINQPSKQNTINFQSPNTLPLKKNSLDGWINTKQDDYQCLSSFLVINQAKKYLSDHKKSNHGSRRTSKQISDELINQFKN